jgi:hypothetical protein
MRCSTVHCILDPCWKEQRERGAKPSAICLVDPWGERVYRALLKDDVPEEEPREERGFPWGIELVSGQRCRLATGAHGSFDDTVVDYYCGRSPYDRMLLRGIDREQPLWKVEAIERTEDGQYRRIEVQGIRIAWY